MKIALPDQIAEAELHRDNLEELIADGVQLPEGSDLENRLHRAEGIVLTLHLIQAQEQDFRAFMRQRRAESKEG